MTKATKKEAKARIRRLNFYANWIQRNPDKIQDLELAKGAYDFCRNHIAQTEREMKNTRRLGRVLGLRSRLRNLLASIVPQNNETVKDGAQDAQ